MPDSSEHDPRPNYRTPPVVETILGMQFERLGGMSNAYLGAFWKSLNTNQWSQVADAPLLQSQFERFTKSASWGKGIAFQLSQDHSTRLQITNSGNDRMIQVQNTRLHLNWLGRGGEDYPRYDAVRADFHEIAASFISFVDQHENIGSLKPNQWEVTYINHIPQGTVWNTPNDWGFFKLLNPLPTLSGLIQGESFGGNGISLSQKSKDGSTLSGNTEKPTMKRKPLY